MLKTNKGFIPIVLVVLISAGVLVAGGGTYAGVTFAQSSKLVKEGDKLVADGNYTEAITKYEKAKKKWRWAKTNDKLANTEELKQLKEYADEGNTQFGNGEWQKCMEYLGKVTSKFPNYSTVQARYSDCQRKLTDQEAQVAAAAKKAADDKAAADAVAAASETIAKPKPTATPAPSASTTETAKPVDSVLYEWIRTTCSQGKWAKSFCDETCGNNDATCKAKLDKSFQDIDQRYNLYCPVPDSSSMATFCTVCKNHDGRCLSNDWSGA